LQRTFELASRTDAVAPVLDAIEACLAENGLPTELTLELRLLGEEAITNIVKYAGANGITVAVEVSEPSVMLELRDDGRPFDPLSAAPPDLDASVEQRPLGGLGIHLLQTLTDAVSYERDADWNVLRLTKNR
jgi:anti-sigma regulatory factor (Ser/Thr protein kinase)